MLKLAVQITVLVTLLQISPAWAQNPCSEEGPGCRVMTAGEVKGLMERILAIKAILPAPDPARYVHDGMAEGGTLPFIGQVKAGGPAICFSFPAGCFTRYDTLSFGYLRKEDHARAGTKPKDILAAVQAVGSALENKVEVTVWLRPHAHLVGNENGKCVDVTESTAVNIEKSATFLSWEDGDEVVNLHLIFGPRTCKEEETLRVETPAKAFAPVRSLELAISGPKAEVAALKKKLDRKAFEGMLGPVVK
jgi:hypothetical protein